MNLTAGDRMAGRSTLSELSAAFLAILLAMFMEIVTLHYFWCLPYIDFYIMMYNNMIFPLMTPYPLWPTGFATATAG